MPRGTRVERCVRKVKKSGRGVNPYAVCQASTKQSYATGKTLESNMKYYLTQTGREFLIENDDEEKKALAAKTAEGRKVSRRHHGRSTVSSKAAGSEAAARKAKGDDEGAEVAIERGREAVKATGRTPQRSR